MTGASRGIGAAVARAVADAGADVVLAARSRASLEELAAELTAARWRWRPKSLTALKLRTWVRRAVERFGRLDAAVNNTGGGFAGKRPIAEVGPAKGGRVRRLWQDAECDPQG